MLLLGSLVDPAVRTPESKLSGLGSSAFARRYLRNHFCFLGRRYDDVAARGSYRIDIHEGPGITFLYLDGRRERMVQTVKGEVLWENDRWRPEGGPSPTWYEIPYRALVPKGSVNVLCAGRMVDSTRDAYGALRVMVNCNQMGETAGLAAARAVREGLAAADAYAGMAH